MMFDGLQEETASAGLLQAKDESGATVPIDVGRLLAEDPNVRKLMTEALTRFIEGGGVTDHPVGFAVTIFDRAGNSGSSLTVDWNEDIDLEHYSPDEEALIARRQ